MFHLDLVVIEDKSCYHWMILKNLEDNEGSVVQEVQGKGEDSAMMVDTTVQLVETRRL